MILGMFSIQVTKFALSQRLPHLSQLSIFLNELPAKIKTLFQDALAYAP